MVTLEIGKELKTFDGKPIPADVAGKPTTIKDVLLHYLGTFNSKDGKKNLEAYALGLKIVACKEPAIDIENAEFAFIKEVTQVSQHGALIWSQLQAVIDSAEGTKK